MRTPQQIDLTDKNNYTAEDLEKLKKAFPELKDIDDFIFMWQNNIIVRIADAYDYEYAYHDHLKFENGFDEDLKCIMPYDEFLIEIKKGYGQSGYVQVARLICLSNGIFYDNEYVG